MPSVSPSSRRAGCSSSLTLANLLENEALWLVPFPQDVYVSLGMVGQCPLLPVRLKHVVAFHNVMHGAPAAGQAQYMPEKMSRRASHRVIMSV